ncbi:MAG: hypothetical protein FRX49_10755 [Trebouxia sp. A1-2]|nr:MAG: hypothetical protein FRX49_10755 [Trebouxia sp. A1-2]
MHRAFLNVGYVLSEKQLRAHFAQFGLVSDTYLPKHTSGRNKGFGFVTFDSAQALDRALLTPAHVIDGVTVQVKRAGPRPPEANRVVPQPADTSAGSANQQQPFGRGPRLYVGGVADAVKEEAIRHHFARWGTVADVYFPGKRGHKRVNYCFVTFEDWKSAQWACDQSERSIDGWPLDSVSLAGARKQESEMHWAPHSSPSASSAQSQSEMAASHLAGLPNYTVWLEQQYFQLQAQMSAQAAASSMPPSRSHAAPLSLCTPQSQVAMSGVTDQEQLIYLQGIQAGLQGKSTHSGTVQALESSYRYAASEGGSPTLVPAERQSQHHVLNANEHFAPPAGGQLPSMTGHDLTSRLRQSGVQNQQLDQAALLRDFTGAEQLALGRSWPGPQATSISEILESE